MSVIISRVLNRAHIVGPFLTTDIWAIQHRVSNTTIILRMKRERTELACAELLRCPVQALLCRLLLKGEGPCCILGRTAAKNTNDSRDN
jgi:hypothetical protein